ncbi:MAG: rRNA maturation RNase YbeY [Epsilonproteobacteria bacterium]|nr:rRNA maturation RNase YbeY [Campylobacterota bacterium]
MILLDNQTNSEIDIKLLEEIANYLKIDKDIELLIVDNETIKELNREYRQIDKPTDVLSFPLNSIEHLPLGSIVISSDKAKSVAKMLNHSISDEISLLFIHGLLHLLGYDHEKDNGEMRELETKIIEKFNLPSSLIVRNIKE